MDDLPMNRTRAQRLARWLKTEHGDKMQAALAGTPFNIDIACGICCKETGLYLLDFIEALSPAEALARCVFDASGDAGGTSRSAFPKNTAEFRARYDEPFADMLVAEANKTRALRGLGPRPWVYKGYGLFQYDLQHVVVDEAFFRERQWANFDACLARLMSELMKKFAIKRDVWKAVQAYNGSGRRAEVYRSHVEQLTEFCAGA